MNHEAKAATCTEIGWNAYDTCKCEGCDYTTYVEIPKLVSAAANEAIEKINVLPATAGTSDKVSVEAARAAYNALTEDQKKLVSADVLNKLTGAESQVKAAEEKAAADAKMAEEKKAAEEKAAAEAKAAAEKKASKDKKKANAAIDAIKALPATAGTTDKAAVEAARKAYDALTKDQKKLVSDKVLNRLTSAETQVAAAVKAAKKVKLTKCTITAKNKTYTGKALKTTITVTYGKKTLKEGADYKVSYKNNVKVGTATATVKGKGKYTGKVKVTFKIKPKKVTGLKLKAGSKKLTATWKKVKGASGYQLQYSTSKKKLSKGKKVTVKKAKTVKTTIKKLKAKKTYYVRIRSYKTVNGKKYYSSWSKAVKVKTKK